MVQPTSRRNVLDRLRDRLLSFRDPQNGNRVIETVQLVVPAPQNASAAPDLIVGYAPGYRASWQTGLGESPPALIEDNDDPWIGDHCINPADIPGVLFTTHPIRLPNPKLQDVTVSVLNLFGVKPHAGISGRTIY
jgi:predicted AlkP superfamily phosphohydrolase/phosphomutase